MNHKTIYLASNSASRKMLLELAQFSFEVIDQSADESTIDQNQSMSDLVQNIALLKMKHALIPNGIEDGQICFVVTADTMNLSVDGQKFGKPKNREEAIYMLRAARAGNVTTTGFCVRKLQWKNQAWHVLAEVVESVEGMCVMDVPEEFLDSYLDTTPYDTLSGALGLEFAPQFCKRVEGSYTAIVGLPLYEFREALYRLGYFQ